MAVVIRLQGLPVVAGSVDIRHFFSGLNIPDGGVHIIGGKAGDAFIIFATDEDARRAMSRTGGVIKNSHIQLFLSSKTEMQNTLELSRRSSQKHPAVPTGSDTFATRKGVNQNKFDKNMSDLGLDNSGMRHTETYSAKYDRREAKNSKVADDVYVHLSGLPYSVTEDDIRKFFSGLDVVEVIFLLRNGGLKTGNGLVKFGSVKDATAALSRHKQYIGARFIVVKMTTEEQWISAGGQVGLTHSKQPRKLRSRSRSPLNQQFYMHLKNLAYNVAKDDIRHFLGLLDLSDAQIKFLLDHNKKKTREGFVMVGSEWELERCMALHKTNLNGRPVFIYPIPRKTMLDLIESSEGQSTARVESFSGNYPQRDNSPIRRSLYLRNFPFDVTKGEVMRFLAGFPVREDDIVLLFDGRGVGLGEALVKFPTEEQALLAERLDRQQFLDTEVLLRRISDEQMKELGVFMDKPADRSPMYRDDYNVSEPVERSYPLLDDLNYGHGDFQERSPERFPRSNQLDFVGGDEYSGKYDPENQNIVDYHHSLPFRSQSLERKTWSAIVRMKNLPYKATMEEILDFFYGYNITHNSVRVKFNKNGMATGLATVYFENYDEAIAAVNELNERPIGTRKITLSVHKLKNV